MQEMKLRINNLNTPADAERITQAMLDVWGISQAEANADHKTLSIMFDERMASTEDFTQAVREAGFNLANE
jgi:copper chaperone CopZ